MNRSGRLFLMFVWMLMLVFFSVGCSEKPMSPVVWPVAEVPAGTLVASPAIHPLEKSFRAARMIDVHTLDTSIRVDLRYGGTDNFMGVDLYQGFNKCFLQPQVARMLVHASGYLQNIRADLRLLVWDAARPLSVQQRMWQEAVPPTGVHKSLFVSNPAYGSIHNFGAAVDITLIHVNGTLVDMGTDLDYFGQEAWPKAEAAMLKNGKLTPAQVTNRQLLRSVMYHAGFWNIQTEWWHFNAMRRNVARERYPMVR
jgi:zinc D-Ala-D-Ala dipeptidase